MVEQVVSSAAEPTSSGSRAATRLLSTPQKLSEITADGLTRLPLPLAEFSRVLGGGIVPGSLILVGGDPGIGKSTLLIDVATLMANNHGATLYISGEESLRQIKMRADRMGLQAENLFLVTETNLEAMMEHIGQIKPLMVVVDSIQTTYTDESKSSG